MRRKFAWVSAVMVIFAVLAVMSCGGAEDESNDCVPSLAITQGTWCISIQSTQNTCAMPLDSTPYSAYFEQAGSNISAVSEFGHTYAGSLCGDTATLTGNNYGISTTTYVKFSDANTASGTVKWNTGTCSGTDTFIAGAGACAYATSSGTTVQ